MAMQAHPPLGPLLEHLPVKVVSERLGHGHIAHTIQTYQHLLPGMSADAAPPSNASPDPFPRTIPTRGNVVGTTGGTPPEPEERPHNDEGPGP